MKEKPLNVRLAEFFYIIFICNVIHTVLLEEFAFRGIASDASSVGRITNLNGLLLALFSFLPVFFLNRNSYGARRWLLTMSAIWLFCVPSILLLMVVIAGIWGGDIGASLTRVTNWGLNFNSLCILIASMLLLTQSSIKWLSKLNRLR